MIGRTFLSRDCCGEIGQSLDYVLRVALNCTLDCMNSMLTFPGGVGVNIDADCATTFNADSNSNSDFDSTQAC